MLASKKRRRPSGRHAFVVREPGGAGDAAQRGAGAVDPAGGDGPGEDWIAMEESKLDYHIWDTCSKQEASWNMVGA